jgi:hypothetical protein
MQQSECPTFDSSIGSSKEEERTTEITGKMSGGENNL